MIPFAIVTEVSVYDFVLVYSYFYCGWNKLDDNPSLNVWVWKVVKAFSKGRDKYNGMDIIMKLVERVANGWERYGEKKVSVLYWLVWEYFQ